MIEGVHASLYSKSQYDTNINMDPTVDIAIAPQVAVNNPNLVELNDPKLEVDTKFEVNHPTFALEMEARNTKFDFFRIPKLSSESQIRIKLLIQNVFQTFAVHAILMIVALDYLIKSFLETKKAFSSSEAGLFSMASNTLINSAYLVMLGVCCFILYVFVVDLYSQRFQKDLLNSINVSIAPAQDENEAANDFPAQDENDKNDDNDENEPAHVSPEPVLEEENEVLNNCPPRYENQGVNVCLECNKVNCLWRE